MVSSEKEALIIPSQLRAAREAMAFSVSDVARQLGVTPQELALWESGAEDPSVERVWELADIYHRSTDYFVKKTAPLPAGMSFRLVQKGKMADLSIQTREVIMRFDELCRAEAELETLRDRKRKILIPKVEVELSALELADKERDRLRLADRPIPDLRALLAQQGVRVFLLPVEGSEFSGLSWWHKEYGPCILINALDLSGRRTFTMAHEYAHLLRRDSPMVCDLELDEGEERLATEFAAVFLMPSSDLSKQFYEKVGEGRIPTGEQLGKLRGRYRVSLEALLWRLEELQLIPRGTTSAKKDEWASLKQFARGRKGPRWRQRLGEEFVGLALEAQAIGQISVGKLAQYLGLDVWEAYDLVEGSKPSGTARSSV